MPTIAAMTLLIEYPPDRLAGRQAKVRIYFPLDCISNSETYNQIGYFLGILAEAADFHKEGNQVIDSTDRFRSNTSAKLWETSLLRRELQHQIALLGGRGEVKWPPSVSGRVSAMRGKSVPPVPRACGRDMGVVSQLLLDLASDDRRVGRAAQTQTDSSTEVSERSGRSADIPPRRRPSIRGDAIPFCTD